jgi:PleD family two-component response regulator
VQELRDEADAKLYWGKRHGKNRVVSVLPDGDAPKARA